MNKLAELVRGDLPKLVRNIIGALITIDVHARDVVTQMVENKVQEGESRGKGGGERGGKMLNYAKQWQNYLFYISSGCGQLHVTDCHVHVHCKWRGERLSHISLFAKNVNVWIL